MPGIGQKYESEDEDIFDIRKWTVKGSRTISFFIATMIEAPKSYELFTPQET